MKGLAKAVLGAVAVFFIVATKTAIGYLLAALTYHPWPTCMALAALLAMFIWLVHGHYNNEPESTQG